MAFGRILLKPEIYLHTHVLTGEWELETAALLQRRKDFWTFGFGAGNCYGKWYC
ncbi:MAG: hypothetical protein HFI19_16415 [Lachnospiraceae bacterium]|jgi:hypothetical protein|uniref:hypothetical protein n=1 Tax=Candidatus Merdisoma sp. JLR.KK006 TaxID=3112626 RepID=UPI002FEFAAFF|nr:hypothetical protein [Lachnospiraceae bacterium]